MVSAGNRHSPTSAAARAADVGRRSSTGLLSIRREIVAVRSKPKHGSSTGWGRYTTPDGMATARSTGKNHAAARSSELIGVGADLGEVVHHGEVALAEVHHVHLDLHHTGTAVRDVHLLEVRPDGTGGVEEVDLLKHIVGERGEQVAQDDLILTKPGSILRIRGALPLVIRREEAIWGRGGAVDIAGDVGDAKGRKDLSFLEKVVGGCEFGSNEASRGLGNSGRCRRREPRGHGQRSQGRGSHGAGGRRTHRAVMRDGLIPCETKRK